MPVPAFYVGAGRPLEPSYQLDACIEGREAVFKKELMQVLLINSNGFIQQQQMNRPDVENYKHTGIRIPVCATYIGAGNYKPGESFDIHEPVMVKEIIFRFVGYTPKRVAIFEQK